MPRFSSLACGLAAALLVTASTAAETERPVDEHAQHRQMAQAPPARYSRTEARYEVPDLPLVTAAGDTTSLRAELDAGTPVMLNFVFTSCTTICPIMSGIFADVQHELGAERDTIRLVSISLDPEHDTPAKLTEYAARFRAGPEWHLLTGSNDNAIAAAKAFGAWRGDKASHAPATYLRAASSRRWLRLDGFASASDLVREYRGLAARQAAGEAR
jgi:protein SCO1/2